MDHLRDRRFLAGWATAVFVALAIGQVALLRALPYSTSELESVARSEVLRTPSPDFRLGKLKWDVAGYRRAPELAPLREYLYRNDGGEAGIAAALGLSKRFEREFPLGQAPAEFVNARYDPVADLRAHQRGQPGHCVTRSGLLAAILLAGGIPARVVQLVPSKGSGHNLVEVWDSRHGWVLVDPSFGGIVGNRQGPCSAVAAVSDPHSVRWLGDRRPRNGSSDPVSLYEAPDAPLLRGQIVYPEPWLYLRTGPLAAEWPFRGRFGHIGPWRWEFGPGQSWLRWGATASLLSALCCLFTALGRRRTAVAGLIPVDERYPMDTSVLLNGHDLLRCPGCQSPFPATAFAICSAPATLSNQETPELACDRCGEVYPIIHGIPRLVTKSMREALGGEIAGEVDLRQVAMAQSFGFEWSRFSEMYVEWERNFLQYMTPRGPDFFQGKRVLDVGCGAGRHAHFAARFGAEVWAVDLSAAVEVARSNTQDSGTVHVIQSDLHRLPFAPESFDFIYCLGVLHHLPDPEAAFQNLVRYLKPGGEIQVYLYWRPIGQPIKQALLALVTAFRQLTTRLPHPVLYPLSYPLAAMVYGGFVLPYRFLRAVPGATELAERVPLRQYADYPFRVCVNDQFDRFSVRIEQRYTREEVAGWLERAGLEQPRVSPNWGWLGTGRRPGRST